MGRHLLPRSRSPNGLWYPSRDPKLPSSPCDFARAYIDGGRYSRQAGGVSGGRARGEQSTEGLVARISLERVRFGGTTERRFLFVSENNNTTDYDGNTIWPDSAPLGVRAARRAAFRRRGWWWYIRAEGAPLEKVDRNRDDRFTGISSLGAESKEIRTVGDFFFFFRSTEEGDVRAPLIWCAARAVL